MMKAITKANEPAGRPGAGTMDAVIHMENVSKVFQTDEVKTHAVSGINLEIVPGEFV